MEGSYVMRGSDGRNESGMEECWKGVMSLERVLGGRDVVGRINGWVMQWEGAMEGSYAMGGSNGGNENGVEVYDGRVLERSHWVGKSNGREKCSGKVHHEGVI